MILVEKSCRLVLSDESCHLIVVFAAWAARRRNCILGGPPPNTTVKLPSSIRRIFVQIQTRSFDPFETSRDRLSAPERAMRLVRPIKSWRIFTTST